MRRGRQPTVTPRQPLHPCARPSSLPAQQIPLKGSWASGKKGLLPGRVTGRRFFFAIRPAGGSTIVKPRGVGGGRRRWPRAGTQTHARNTPENKTKASSPPVIRTRDHPTAGNACEEGGTAVKGGCWPTMQRHGVHALRWVSVRQGRSTYPRSSAAEPPHTATPSSCKVPTSNRPPNLPSRQPPCSYLQPVLYLKRGRESCSPTCPRHEAADRMV